MNDLHSIAKQLGLKLVVQQPEQEFLDIKQVASMFGVSTRTIRRLWSSGGLPEPIRIGRAVRWRKLDLENHNYGSDLQTDRKRREAG